MSRAAKTILSGAAILAVVACLVYVGGDETLRPADGGG